MKKILKAKHWQVFIVLFVLPMVIQMAFMAVMVINIISAADRNPEEIYKVIRFVPIVMLVYIVPFYVWLWSVAIGLQKYQPKELVIRTRLFKLLLLFSAVYYLFYASLIAHLMAMQGSFNPLLFVAIIPFNLVAAFCMLYSFFLAAKIFKTAELQRPVTFGDFVGEFFLIWFYPIGIWFIQPKINKIVEEREQEQEQDNLHDSNNSTIAHCEG